MKVSRVMLKGSDTATGLHPARHLFLCKLIMDAKVRKRQSQNVLLFSTWKSFHLIRKSCLLNLTQLQWGQLRLQEAGSSGQILRFIQKCWQGSVWTKCVSKFLLESISSWHLGSLALGQLLLQVDFVSAVLVITLQLLPAICLHCSSHTSSHVT